MTSAHKSVKSFATHAMKSSAVSSDQLRTSFELEPNPFERLFAPDEPQHAFDKKTQEKTPKTDKAKPADMRFPAVADQERLPGLTPPLYTPGGHRLRAHLLPGAAMGLPGTPGMWNSLLNATNGSLDLQNPAYQQVMRKVLTPNELNLRTGLTPGIPGYGFNQMHTPGMLNEQITPGLLLLLGLGVHQNANAHANAAVVAAANAAATDDVDVKQESSDGGSTNNVPLNGAVPMPVQSMPMPMQQPLPPVGQMQQPMAKLPDPEPPEKEKEEPRKRRRKNERNGDDEKRKQFLERNRVAALKCRQRKKQLFRKMEDELAFYSTGYRELSAQVTLLRQQLMTVRDVLVGHKDCPTLVSTVGGFPQLQNILGLADFAAQVAANAQPQFTLIPTTIPTTLNPPPQPAPVQPAKPIDTPQMEMMEENHDMPRQAMPEMYPPVELRHINSALDIPAEKQPQYLRTVASMTGLQGRAQ